MEDTPTINPRAPTDFDQAVGQRIAALRKARGMSRTALAAAIDVTFQQLAKYERGQNRIRGSRLQQVARALAVPGSDLIKDAADSHPSEVFALLGERGAVDVLKTFAAIEDAHLQQVVLAFVRRSQGSLSDPN